MNCIQRLLAGDREQIPIQYNEHKGLIRKATARFRRTHPWLAEDILSVAKTSMLERITYIAEGGEFDGDNLAPYLATWIRWDVKRYLAENHLVKIPYRAYVKMAEGYRWFPLLENDCPVTKEHTVEDYQDACAEERDKIIIQLLWDGIPKKEIAIRLNVSPATISGRIKCIRRRLKLEGV